MSVSSKSSDSKGNKSRKPTRHQIIAVMHDGNILTTKIRKSRLTSLVYRNSVYDDSDKSMSNVTEALRSGFRIKKIQTFHERNKYIFMICELISYNPEKLNPEFEMIPFETFKKCKLFKHAKAWLEEYEKYKKKSEDIVIVPLESDW